MNKILLLQATIFIVTASSCAPSLPSTRTPIQRERTPTPTFAKHVQTLTPIESQTTRIENVVLLDACSSQIDLFHPEFTDPLSPLRGIDSLNLTSLPDYSESNASDLIRYLKAYPASLDYVQRGYHNSAYYYSHNYIRLVEDDALSRFPNSQYASEWEWDRAFNLLLADESEVYASYRTLILLGLNEEMISPNDLSCWFQRHEGRIHLKVYTLLPLPESHESAYIIQISDSYDIAGIYFFAHQSNSFFSIEPLPFDSELFFGTSSGLDFAIVDFTGDSYPEIAISHAFFPGSGDAVTTSFNVFDVSSGDPILLEFDPPLPLRHERTWELIEQTDAPPLFKLTLIFDRMVCPFTHAWIYQWDGSRLVQVQRNIATSDKIEEQMRDPIGQTTAAECKDIYVSYLSYGLYRGDLSVLDSLLEYAENWPYSKDWSTIDPPLSANSSSLRFLIALYLTNLGEYDQANDILQVLASSSEVVDDVSILAKAFFGVGTRENFRNACRSTGVCYSLLYGDEFLKNIPPIEGVDIALLFRDFGMMVEESRRYDLDQDGILDSLILKVSSDAPPVSTLGDEPIYYSMFIVHELTNRYSVDQLSKDYSDFPVIQPGPSYAGIPSIVVSDPESRETYIYDQSYGDAPLMRLCYWAGNKLSEIVNQPLDGDLNSSLSALESLARPLIDGCSGLQPNDPGPTWLYYHARLNEALGKDQNALESYVQILRAYPDSPYALLSAGRLKLIP